MTQKTWQELLAEAGDIDAGFVPIPEGEYDMKVLTSTFKPTDKGKPMFKLLCEVTTGPYKGRKVYTNIVVSPDSDMALKFFFRKMRALGLPPEYFQAEPDHMTVNAQLKGKDFRATVGIKPYQGQDRNEITSMSPPVGGVPGMVGAVPPPPPVAAAAPPPPPPVPAAVAPVATQQPAVAPAPVVAPAPAVAPAAAPAAVPAAAPAAPTPEPQPAAAPAAAAPVAQPAPVPEAQPAQPPAAAPVEQQAPAAPPPPPF